MAVQKINDRWFRFLGIPFFALMGHLLFYNRNDTGEERFGFWTIYFLGVAETILVWEVNRQVIIYFRKRYPELPETTRRIVMIFLCCTLVTIVVRSLNMLLYDKTNFWGYPFPVEAYFQSIFVALLFLIVIGGMYEGIYYFSKWKDIAVEAESLKKENLQTQLDSLKTQLSPHFLFNSLGSLSSLIDENPKKAQEFVGQMSAVYRYLLQASEKDLISVRKEMDFIEAYSNMLKTRFPEGLKLSVNIHEPYWGYLLPPLTLQILLENAVKHNAVMFSKPLQVNMYTDEAGHLIVENNLQKKTSPVLSNKMGLNNIIVKYKLLDQPDITIKETTTHFQVTVPLIKNKRYAGLDSGR